MPRVGTTALVDACTLAGVLRRNLLLTLAEAELFRLRWSKAILDETERAIEKMARGKDLADPKDRAARARRAMEAAFEDAMVKDFERFEPVCADLPDKTDIHVAAAALKARATIIVTENLVDFPETILARLGLEARSADAFIADMISLDTEKATTAIKTMRMRFKQPQKTADELLRDMQEVGLHHTVEALRAHLPSL